ncbi:MAG: MBOAT family protein [Rhodospirillales bacterium]|nr:MBOAT family protein [Rhodospirillales bacterium]
MLFHSQIFLLLFLPVALLGYYRLAVKGRSGVWWLSAASFVFYGYWDLRLLPLLAGSIAVNWMFAQGYMRARGFDGDRRYLVPLGVFLNLLVIGVFKYADFFSDSLAWLNGGEHAPWSIILPLGISFFTFQQISYLVDLKREAAPAYRFRDYVLYVSFFPQLIAGPIVRHNEFIFQLKHDPLREGLSERLSRGLVLLLIGLVKKVFVADRLAQMADPVFAQAAAGQAITAADAWMADIAFGLQIYFDFSGYSDMAIGLALMFGFTLPINFKAPYAAASIREFWRCWHMTLSRFLRDYLYIPLGGSRHGALRHGLALIITMLLGGLWHGANWTFVAWGGAHGLGLAANTLWDRYRLRALPRPVGWVATFVFVFSVWVLFRAESFDAALSLYSAMALMGAKMGSLTSLEQAVLLAGGLAVATLGPCSQDVARKILRPRPAVAVISALALVAVLLQVGLGRNIEFIYFQF